MATADTNNVATYFLVEDEWGTDLETIAAEKRGKMYGAGISSSTLSMDKETVSSDVLSSDRMRDNDSVVGISCSGDLGFQLSSYDWDIPLAHALASEASYIFSKTYTGTSVTTTKANNRFTISSGGTVGLTVGAEVYISGLTAHAANVGRFKITAVTANSFTVSGNSLENETSVAATNVIVRTDRVRPGDLVVASSTTITSTSLDFTSLGLEVGQWFTMGGLSDAENVGKRFRIASVTANTITINSGTLKTASGQSSTGYLIAKRIKNGVKKTSILVQFHHTDVETFSTYSGLRTGGVKLNFEAKKVITGTFSYMGKKPGASTSSISPLLIPAEVTEPLTASNNIGSIIEGGTVISTGIKTIDLDVNNYLRSKPSVGTQYPIDIGYGYCECTGTLEAYFSDLRLLSKVLNHTETSIEYGSTDAKGNMIQFSLLRVVLTSGSPSLGGGNQDSMLNINFKSLKHPDSGSVIIIDSLNVE